MIQDLIDKFYFIIFERNLTIFCDLKFILCLGVEKTLNSVLPKVEREIKIEMEEKYSKIKDFKSLKITGKLNWARREKCMKKVFDDSVAYIKWIL